MILFPLFICIHLQIFQKYVGLSNLLDVFILLCIESVHFCSITKLTEFAYYKDAVQQQRFALVAAVTSAVGESSGVPVAIPEEKIEEIFEPLGIQIQQLPRHDVAASGTEGEEASNTVVNVEEHQFISNFVGMSPVRDDQDAPRSITNLNNPSEEELAMSLHLGDREPKRLRSDSGSSLDLEK